MKIVKGNFKKESKGAENKNQFFEKMDTKSSGNKELSYSEMFRDLIKPFMNGVHDALDLETIVQMGMLAWNLEVTKLINLPGFKQLFESTMKEADFNKDESATIKKMMKACKEKYPDNDFFIEKYELKDDKNGTHAISIAGKSISNLPAIEEDEDFEDEDFDDIQFEQGIVNRSAFSLKYKPAFVEFIKQNDSFPGLVELEDSTVYLIEEKDTQEEASEWLKKNFEKIMVNELEDVTFDEAKWPRRTYKVFCDLFEIRFHDMVMDLENEPVIKV